MEQILLHIIPDLNNIYFSTKLENPYASKYMSATARRGGGGGGRQQPLRPHPSSSCMAYSERRRRRRCNSILSHSAEGFKANFGVKHGEYNLI